MGIYRQKQRLLKAKRLNPDYGMVTQTNVNKILKAQGVAQDVVNTEFGLHNARLGYRQVPVPTQPVIKIVLRKKVQKKQDKTSLHNYVKPRYGSVVKRKGLCKRFAKV